MGDAIEVYALNQIGPTRIWRVLIQYVLAIVLEGEHARCARVLPRENSRFIFSAILGLERADIFWFSKKKSKISLIHSLRVMMTIWKPPLSSLLAMCSTTRQTSIT